MRVIVIPDNDKAGRKHADAVARQCCDGGLEVQVVTLPNLPPKGDVSDWLDAGHTKNELMACMTPSTGSVAAAAARPYPASPDSDRVASSTPLDLADTLDAIESFVRQFVVLSREQSRLVTLWIAQPHAMSAFDYVAYLNIKSPMAEREVAPPRSTRGARGAPLADRSRDRGRPDAEGRR